MMVEGTTQSARLVRGVLSFLLGLLGVAASCLAAWLVLDRQIEYSPFNLLLFTARLVAIGAVGMSTVAVIDPNNQNARIWCFVLGCVCLVPFVLWPPMWLAGGGSAISFVLSSIFPGRKLAAALLAVGVIVLLSVFVASPKKPDSPIENESFVRSSSPGRVARLGD